MFGAGLYGGEVSWQYLLIVQGTGLLRLGGGLLFLASGKQAFGRI